MAIVLALVPTLGREHLAFEQLDGRSLVDRAVTAAALATKAAATVATKASVTVVVRSEFVRVLPLLSHEVAVVVVAADQSASDESVRSWIRGVDVVAVHDPLCPLVAPDLIVSMLRRLTVSGEADCQTPALVASRPVVDTLKRLDAGGLVKGTTDRDTVRAVLSPVVTTGRRLSGIPDLHAALSDPACLVRGLRATGAVELVDVPASARRVDGRAALLAMSLVADSTLPKG